MLSISNTEVVLSVMLSFFRLAYFPERL
ncbi:MAG TPA: hypothetical protein DF698_03765 [Candidatus Atribacteria bacterium]|nr:hypothetical protein [Candidatus Atribacteria bacterium]